jgi:hypothetical protein
MPAVAFSMILSMDTSYGPIFNSVAFTLTWQEKIHTLGSNYEPNSSSFDVVGPGHEIIQFVLCDRGINKWNMSYVSLHNNIGDMLSTSE